MTDIVERLRAPAYWISGSSEGHEGDNSAPLEAAAEIERLRAALAWIDQQRYTGRDTINPANGYDHAIALNEKLLALMDVARAALEERT
jgi:hypothetical protein